MAEAEELQEAIRNVIGAFADGALTADGDDPIARVSKKISIFLREYGIKYID